MSLDIEYLKECIWLWTSPGGSQLGFMTPKRIAEITTMKEDGLLNNHGVKELVNHYMGPEAQKKAHDCIVELKRIVDNYESGKHAD